MTGLVYGTAVGGVDLMISASPIAGPELQHDLTFIVCFLRLVQTERVQRSCVHPFRKAGLSAKIS